MITLNGRIISITQHNSGTISFDFSGPDGVAIPLTDYIVTFMVKHKKSDDDSTAIIKKTYQDLEGNTCTVELLPEDTNKPVDFYYWSILLENNTYRNEALSGPFYIIEGVQD